MQYDKETLELVRRCDPYFLIRHLKEHTIFDVDLLQKIVDMAKEYARCVLQQAEPGADERAARALCAAAAKRSDKTDGELWGEYQDEFIADAKAALLAAQSGQRAGVAEGWKLVPKEPTQAMFLAAEAAGVAFVTQQKCWAAMLAAAPTQQQEGGKE